MLNINPLLKQDDIIVKLHTEHVDHFISQEDQDQEGQEKLFVLTVISFKFWTLCGQELPRGHSLTTEK